MEFSFKLSVNVSCMKFQIIVVKLCIICKLCLHLAWWLYFSTWCLYQSGLLGLLTLFYVLVCNFCSSAPVVLISTDSHDEDDFNTPVDSPTQLSPSPLSPIQSLHHITLPSMDSHYGSFESLSTCGNSRVMRRANKVIMYVLVPCDGIFYSCSNLLVLSRIVWKVRLI